MTSSPLQRTVALLPSGLAALLALGPASLSPLRAEPLPPPPPLNPAWAFDPNGPFLPGADPPSFLLPGNGQGVYLWAVSYIPLTLPQNREG